MRPKSKILLLALIVYPFFNSNAFSAYCGLVRLPDFEAAMKKCYGGEGCHFEELDKDCGFKIKNMNMQETCLEKGCKAVESFDLSFA